MYDATVGRFLQEDPIESDANLYRYCENAPTDAIDPTGLKKVPLPAPGPGKTATPCSNIPMAWYRRPYGLAPILPSKPMMIKRCGELKPQNCGLALSGASSGTHHIAGLPLGADSYCGVSGAGPCIGVVVVCPNQVLAFHFSAGDDAGATLSQYAWPKGCRAAICGGNNTAVSNDQLVEVRNSLKFIGIKLDGIVNMDGCWYGPGGEWYVGSTTSASQDSSHEKF